MSKPSLSSKPVVKPPVFKLEVATEGSATAIIAHKVDGKIFPLATKISGLSPYAPSKRSPQTSAQPSGKQKKKADPNLFPLIACTQLVAKLDGTTRATVFLADDVEFMTRDVVESMPDILAAFREAKINPPQARRSVPLYLAEKLRLRLH